MSSATYPAPGAPTSRRADMPVGEGELDDDLANLVRRTSVVRQGFYVVVLLVALAGQVSGAVEALGIPLPAAIPAVAALELGGIVVLANADVRRRLGERAVASRLLSVAIAGGATTFNWLAHSDHLLGGFFAGMSLLGYLVWLMHTENQRRDRLRIKGDLPPTTPAYELGGHWLRHPWLTMRAKGLAKADPRLGLYDSIAQARADVRRERRHAAIAKVLHRKIKSSVDPRTADIAIAVYDLDEIAARLAAQADYDGLTALIAADLTPARIHGEPPDDGGSGATSDWDSERAWQALTAETTATAPTSPAPFRPLYEPFQRVDGTGAVAVLELPTKGPWAPPRLAQTSPSTLPDAATYPTEATAVSSSIADRDADRERTESVRSADRDADRDADRSADRERTESDRSADRERTESVRSADRERTESVRSADRDADRERTESVRSADRDADRSADRERTESVRSADRDADRERTESVRSADRERTSLRARRGTDEKALVADTRRVVRDLKKRGEPVVRKTVIPALRELGHSLENASYAPLMAKIRK